MRRLDLGKYGVVLMGMLVSASVKADAEPRTAHMPGWASRAESEPSSYADEPRLDVELDPIAYALEGYSVHAGLRYDFWRLDIGAFAALAPEFSHGNQGIEAYGGGFGLKWDIRFTEDQSGFLVGVEANTSRWELRNSASGDVDRQRLFNVGMRVGWEFLLDYGFYVVPWVGVAASLGGEDVTLGSGADAVRWDSVPYQVFPTVHLGWRSP